MKQALYLGAASALALMVGFSAGAHAASAVIDGITVTNSGLADPSLPDYPQPVAFAATGALLQFAWVGSSLSNQGWDPFGPSDTSHHWWNIGEGGGSVGFNLSGSNLKIVWGSPNYTTTDNDNYVSFYTGTGGTGALIGRVDAADLYNNFSGIDNNNHAGYLIDFKLPQAYKSVVFATNPTAFEFALAAPELSTWGMMLAGFAGLGFVGYGRKRREAALSA
ncbi:hypothetical protein [uncultured Rhodoblastus sp.]|uniref:hypothetical protein n=1 Tax=uncultured Rhodoblastus sp. TaxID=543037 RepID=UPI0025D514C0|nr:hypothetical protein [uncultured Rhodoblastus sp.]